MMKRKREKTDILPEVCAGKGVECMRFTKMHGIGNDYIYVNGAEESVPDPQELARIISDRHFGAGSDGLVIIDPISPGRFRMRMYNSDGSEGRMCGNAARCVGKYVFERGLTDCTELILDTASGERKLKLYPEEGTVKRVLVDMGIAEFSSEKIPVLLNTGKGEPVHVDGVDSDLICVSMGNPHCVLFTDEDPEDMDIRTTGTYLEHHPVFPEGGNVEFAKVLDAQHVKMRVWERGSGETMACGTGACAVVAAGIQSGRLSGKVQVQLLGGILQVFMTDEGRVFQEGPAEFVYDGIWLE